LACIVARGSRLGEGVGGVVVKDCSGARGARNGRGYGGEVLWEGGRVVGYGGGIWDST